VFALKLLAVLINESNESDVTTVAVAISEVTLFENAPFTLATLSWDARAFARSDGVTKGEDARFDWTAPSLGGVCCDERGRWLADIGGSCMSRDDRVLREISVSFPSRARIATELWIEMKLMWVYTFDDARSIVAVL
jgi:hypothetical protein